MSHVEQDKSEQATAPSAPSHWGRRLAWFTGLWLASVSALGVVAWALKKLLNLD